MAIDGYLVISGHCLILEGFRKYRSQRWSVLRRQSGKKSETIWQESGRIARQMIMPEKSDKFLAPQYPSMHLFNF
jgi:hypothetical protein